MASTSTNKQPLLVDRVFHEVYSMNTATVLQTDITGTNYAQLVLNCSQNDGAIIEDIYVISRGQDGDKKNYTVNLYMSNDTDFLRPPSQAGGAVTGGIHVGKITSGATAGTLTHSADLPFVLAPVPQVGSNPKLTAFYIPKGKTLWAARQTTDLADDVTNAPLLGVQGGFY